MSRVCRGGNSWYLLVVALATYAVTFLVADAYMASGWGEAWGLYWNFPSHCQFFVIPILAALLGCGTAHEYGLTAWRWRENLRFGLVALAAYALVPYLMDWLFAELTVKPPLQERLGETVLFQLVFAAFGEELYFRGFMQGAFNRIWGRTLHLGGVRFGPGLYVTALLFGVAHLLNPTNFLTGTYGFDWSAFGWTTGGGLVLGFARERSGSLLVPVLLHFGMNAYVTVCTVHGPGSAGKGLVEFWIIFALIYGAFRDAESRPPTRDSMPEPACDGVQAGRSVPEA